MDKDCLFCKMIEGKIPSKKVAETTDILAFLDNYPSADTHILIVPKKHFASFQTVVDWSIIVKMFKQAQQLINDKKLEGKYKLLVNGGHFQSVPHLHLHLLGGELKKYP